MKKLLGVLIPFATIVLAVFYAGVMLTAPEGNVWRSVGAWVVVFCAAGAGIWCFHLGIRIARLRGEIAGLVEDREKFLEVLESWGDCP